MSILLLLQVFKLPQGFTGDINMCKPDIGNPDDKSGPVVDPGETKGIFLSWLIQAVLVVFLSVGDMVRAIRRFLGF